MRIHYVNFLLVVTGKWFLLSITFSLVLTLASTSALQFPWEIDAFPKRPFRRFHSWQKQLEMIAVLHRMVGILLLIIVYPDMI